MKERRPLDPVDPVMPLVEHSWPEPNDVRPLELWHVWHTLIRDLCDCKQRDPAEFPDYCARKQWDVQNDYPEILESKAEIFELLYFPENAGFFALNHKCCYSDEYSAEQALCAIQFFIARSPFDPIFNVKRDGHVFALSELLVQRIQDSLIPDHRICKTLRFDEFCFAKECFESVTPRPGRVTNKPLRPGHAEHRPYTVLSEGVSEYDKKPRNLTKTPAERAERSKGQSVSLVNLLLGNPLFGHNRDRRDELVGLWIDLKDVRERRRFRYDGGTIFRSYEFFSLSDANKRHQHLRPRAGDPVLMGTREEAFAMLKKYPESYTEWLANIRWHPLTSGLAICGASFEARCIAQLYASLMKRALHEKYAALSQVLPESYEVPIKYYLPGNHANNFRRYTAEEQLRDCHEAMKIFHDPALCALKLKDSKFVFLWLIADRVDVLRFEYEGMPLIFWIVNAGLIELADALLLKSGITQSLEVFLRESHFVEIVRSARARGILADRFDKQSKAYISAVAAERSELIRLFAEAQMTYSPDDSKRSLLQTAVYFAKAESTHALCELSQSMKLDVNARFPVSRETPLIWAAQNGYVDVVRVLLRFAEVDVHAKNKDGRSALELAIVAGFTKTTAVLLSCPEITRDLCLDTVVCRMVDPKYVSLSKMLPYVLPYCHNRDVLLRKIITYNLGQALDVLLECPGVDVNQIDAIGDTPLMFALKERADDCVPILLKRIDLEIGYRHAKTHQNALSAAARYSDGRMLELLLRDPRVDASHYSTEEGVTIVHRAVRSQRLDNVSAVLKCVPPEFLNATTLRGISPLLEAVLARGSLVVVHRLLECRDIDVNVKDLQGRTVLMNAIAALVDADEFSTAHYLECIKRLLNSRGIDVNAKDHDGCTPLILAGEHGFESVVQWLLHHPSIQVNDVNTMTGNTVLMSLLESLPRDHVFNPTLYRQKRATIDLLLSTRGDELDLSLRNHRGQSALEMAMPECVDPLIQLDYSAIAEKIFSFVQEDLPSFSYTDCLRLFRRSLGVCCGSLAIAIGRQMVYQTTVFHDASPTQFIGLKKILLQDLMASVAACKRVETARNMQVFRNEWNLWIGYLKLECAVAKDNDAYYLIESPMMRLLECLEWYMHTVTFRSQQIFSSLKKNGDQANLVGFVKTLSLVLKDPARSEEWKDALAVFLENIQRSVMDTKTSSKLHGLYWMAQRVNREWVDAAHPHVIVHRQT